MNSPVSTTVAVVAAVSTSDLDPTLVEQAAEFELEQALIGRAHPDVEDQILHRHHMCDGSCVQALNGYNLD